MSIGDDGLPATPGVLIVEDRATRRRRRILHLITEGYALENVRSTVLREFHITAPTFRRDMDALGEFARAANDDEAYMDVVVRDVIDKMRQLLAVNYANATVPIDVNNTFDGKTLTDLFKAQLAASKETRATGETVVNLFGRRSKRWSPKQQVEVTAVAGGTAEQQEAVRRLLGQEDAAPAVPQIEEDPEP
jgi:hypothetical protein